MTDFNDIVLRAQQGSKPALNAVIKYMYKSLYAKVTKMWKELPGGHTAEDIIQYSMIAVIKAIETYNGNGYAKNWIYLNVRSMIDNEARYLNYDKRKSNLNSYSMDRPLKADENITFAHIIPCRANTEQEALDNVITENFIQGLRSELSKFEFTIINYMMLDYATKDIIKATGCKPKTIDNAKERIKVKVRRYLAAG